MRAPCLLVAATFFAVQQHLEATTWMNRDHAEVAADQSQTHKSTGLFESLLASQQEVKTVTNEKNKACLLLESVTRNPARLATAGCAT
jgi:hypothetical protein